MEALSFGQQLQYIWLIVGVLVASIILFFVFYATLMALFMTIYDLLYPRADSYDKHIVETTAVYIVGAISFILAMGIAVSIGIAIECTYIKITCT